MKKKPLTILAVLLILLTFITQVQAAPQFGNNQFKEVWAYSDKRVDEVPGAGRGYTWGPNSFGVLTEDYVEAIGGKRQVQYFDKSRMEISTDGKFVTNGLLTKELVNGSRQDGNAKFTQLAPSTVAVAGDDNSGGGNAVAPTYASFKGVVTFNPGENTAANQVGKVVNQGINKAGEVKTLDAQPAQVVIGSYEPVLGHNVPQVFLDFQNITGLVWNGTGYITAKVYTDNPTANVFGFPISEAFWAKAVVAGQEKDVLIQLYERRVLTYTPSNPTAFQVEMGNIGQHYYQWRYGNATPVPTTTPAPATTVTFLQVRGGPPNANAYVQVQTSPNTVCSIEYIVPSGRVSTAADLYDKTSNSSGIVDWTWKIGSQTAPGTGKVTVTCNKVSASSAIKIG